MLYRFDLHVHSFFSADAASSPEAIIAAARSRGLNGIVLTDHNTCEATAYCLERGLMNPEGLPVDDFLVVPGVEVSTGDGHMLCIGAVLPEMVGVPAVVVEKAIHEAGAIAIPAHPYDRWRAGIREEVLDQLTSPMIEVFNAAVSSRAYNRQARAYAERTGRNMTASSDAHHASAVGTAFTEFEMAELSVKELLNALPQGGTLHENYLSRVEGFKKHFGNWFRVFNPSPTRPGS